MMKLHEMANADDEFNRTMTTVLTAIEKLHKLADKFGNDAPVVNSQVDSLIHAKGGFGELIDVYRAKRVGK